MSEFKTIFCLPDGIDRIIAGERLGIPYASWLLRNRYFEGRGVEQSLPKAINCYLQAALGCCPLGQRSYAELIGRHQVPNATRWELLYWRIQAAHNPDAISQLKLGEMYLYGKDSHLRGRYLDVDG